MKLLFEMTEEEAKQMGLLCCESCGHPENNHFNFRSVSGKDRPCAHCPKGTCQGYKPVARVGKLVEVVSIKPGMQIRIYGETYKVCQWNKGSADETIAIDVKKVK